MEPTNSQLFQTSLVSLRKVVHRLEIMRDQEIDSAGEAFIGIATMTQSAMAALQTLSNRARGEREPKQG